MKIIIKKDNALTKITLKYKEIIGKNTTPTTVKWEFTLEEADADKLKKELVAFGYLQPSQERSAKYTFDIDKDDFYKLYEKVFGRSLKS